MWYTWFLTVKGKSREFSYKDIGYDDLKYMEENNLIELIEKYEDTENEFDKKRYRIKNIS